MAELAQTDRAPDSGEKSGYSEGSVEAFLYEARKRFEYVTMAESFNRKEAVDDLRFKQGEQWPDQIKSERTIQRRPCLTVNKMKTFVHQITNDQRQNRPAINVSPVGDKADPETARMLKGLIKQIERQSNADVAYDTGFDNAVSNGWGFWRVLTEYENDSSFNQCLRIGRIRNPFRVYLDPDRQEPDGSDAQYGFISDLIPREEFKRDYPKADPCEWAEGAMGDTMRDWSTNTHVRIAEYYKFKFRERRLLALSNGHIGYEDELADEVMEAVKLDPEQIVNERTVYAKQLCWYKITAKEILDEQELPGKWIPIIECIGDEVDIEGKVTRAGLIRDAKDPQRMYNFWVTAETEMIALAPKAPWIMEEGQVEGHEKRWQEANVKSYPYLLYKGTSIAGKPSPPPQRQQFTGPPTAIVQAKIGAAQDMQAATGVRFDATLNERMHDESGRAIRELKRVGELGNFHYVDNLARSLRHTGRILIDLIPKYYDTQRVLTILREDGTEEQVMLDPNAPKPFQTQDDPASRVKKIYNPRVGDYEVAVTIGPSFATKRAEAADSMVNFIKVVPQAAPLIGDLIAKNLDWPGAPEISERLQTMLPPQIQDKQIQNLPQEAKAIVGGLKQQLEQANQQLQQATAMLGEQDKDRAIQQDKINKDFEAKMAQIASTMEQTVMKIMADRAKEGEDKTQAAMEKIAKDFEAKIVKIVADYDLGELQLEMEGEREERRMQMEAEAREREMAQDGMLRSAEIEQSGEIAREGQEVKAKAEKKNGAAKRNEKPKAQIKMPDIHIHMPSGKKKITKDKDGSYTSEDVGE